jgi:hypothetical protein
MEQLIIHKKEGLLELSGFLLHTGDQVEVRLMGAFVPGIIAHDRRGWYLLTSNRVGVRLRAGLLARISSPFLLLPTRLKNGEH